MHFLFSAFCTCQRENLILPNEVTCVSDWGFCPSHSEKGGQISRVTRYEQHHKHVPHHYKVYIHPTMNDFAFCAFWSTLKPKNHYSSQKILQKRFLSHLFYFDCIFTKKFTKRISIFLFRLQF